MIYPEEASCALQKVYILLLFNGILCMCLLGPLVLQCCSTPLFPDFLSECSIIDSMILKYLIIELLSISPFSSVNICFTFLAVLMFYAYTYLELLDLPSDLNFCHFVMSFLCLLTVFWLKVYSFNLILATPAFFWLPFAGNIYISRGVSR